MFNLSIEFVQSILFSLMLPTFIVGLILIKNGKKSLNLALITTILTVFLSNTINIYRPEFLSFLYTWNIFILNILYVAVSVFIAAIIIKVPSRRLFSYVGFVTGAYVIMAFVISQGLLGGLFTLSMI